MRSDLCGEINKPPKTKKVRDLQRIILRGVVAVNVINPNVSDNWPLCLLFGL